MIEGANERRFGALNGRKAIITGAAGGIGHAITERFVAEGASVVAMDLPEPLNATEWAAGSITPVAVDLSN